MERYLDENGKELLLGPTIGVGGEGNIYELIGDKENVVKIYNSPIAHDKVLKLKSMVGRFDSLKNWGSFPSRLAYHRQTGSLSGFVMSRAPQSFKQLHFLYSPAQRKQTFPKADWGHLIQTARNLAATFEVLHHQEIIIGDVNQGNFLVSHDSTTFLIDCDSFQFTMNGVVHKCEVGVAHFTPPELHNVKSFRDVIRTKNHDNFGLAVLCFHLLFMGRHPFAGIYRGAGGDMPIEKAIPNFLFAYSAESAARGMYPPPNTLDPAIMSPQLVSAFASAFSQRGAQGVRPSARDWRILLDDLRANLRTCSYTTAHKFHKDNSDCPWCQAEQATNVVFFLGNFTATSQAFNLNATWQQICSISVIPQFSLQQPVANSFVPNPLPDSYRTQKRINIAYRAVAAFALIASLAVPYGIVLGVIIAYFMLSFANEDPERKKRIERLSSCKLQWELGNGELMKVGRDEFTAISKVLENSYRSYSSLAEQLKNEQQKLHETVRDRQLYAFLDRHLIDNAQIPGIGQGLKDTLRSWGIETAADVEWHKIAPIPRFGDSRTSSLVAWRNSIASSFVFDKSKGVDLRDLSAVDQRFRRLMILHERELIGGADKLRTANAFISKRQGKLKSALTTIYNEYGQAMADVSIL